MELILESLEAVTCIPGLGTAFAVAIMLHRAVEMVQWNKRLVTSLNNRVVYLLTWLNEKGIDGLSTEVAQFEAFLVSIVKWVEKQSTKNVLQQWAQEQNIRRKLLMFESEFQTFLHLFQIELLVEKQEWTRLEQSYVQDVEEIKSMLLKQEESVETLASNMGALSHTMVDTMSRLETIMKQQRDTAVVERLEQIMTLLETQSHTRIRKPTESWLNVHVDDVELVSQVPIGKGSYGEVFLAQWEGHTIAIKRAAHSDARQDAFLDVLSKELAVWKELRHPNVISLLVYSGLRRVLVLIPIFLF
jgi:son of sevenless-like protein